MTAKNSCVLPSWDWQSFYEKVLLKQCIEVLDLGQVADGVLHSNPASDSFAINRSYGVGVYGGDQIFAVAKDEHSFPALWHAKVCSV
ncbi:MAG: hypothetical protein NXI04_28840 [Planctomycetaceae bacterium]|nr:hypothetical protein [Planctomycetaceae bacterium]